MKTGIHYLMYGTTDVYITPDCTLYDVNGRVMRDSWTNRTLVDTPIPDYVHLTEGHEAPLGHRLTFGEAMMFTLYGRSMCPITARYADEPPTYDNIAYDINNWQVVLRPNGPDLTLCANGKEETFKFMYRNSNSRVGRGIWEYVYFINQYGAILELTVGATQKKRIIPWEYHNAYPFSASISSTTSIHDLVYRIWVQPDVDFESKVVHHKDECPWNSDKDNLTLMTRSDHIAGHHRGPRKPGSIGYDKIERAFQMIEQNAHIDDIILMMTDGRSDLRTTAQNIVKRILNNPKSYPMFRDKYDVSGYQKFKGKKVNEAVIEQICQLLATNDPRYTDLYLAELTGMTATFIRQIRTNALSNKTAQAIRSKYADKISAAPRATGQFTKKMTPNQIRTIMWLCKCSNLSNQEIAELFNGNNDMIRNIRIADPKCAYLDIVKEPITSSFTEYDRKYGRTKTGVQLVDSETGRLLSPVDVITEFQKRIMDPNTNEPMTDERTKELLRSMALSARQRAMRTK